MQPSFTVLHNSNFKVIPIEINIMDENEFLENIYNDFYKLLKII